MEGLIDNAKKFMASEEGQKMQATFEQQGGADVDQFLGQNKSSSSSGDNVNFTKSSGGEASYGAGSNTANQYSAQNQNEDLLNEGTSGGNGQTARGDPGIVGDAGKANVRESDHDYSGYGGEDSTAEGGWGANQGGDSFSRQNQLGVAEDAAAQGRTDLNDTNYDGVRGGRAFDASGTSTPAYRQEDEEYENGDNSKSGKTQGGGGSAGLNPYGDNSTKMDNPLHEQHH